MLFRSVHSLFGVLLRLAHAPFPLRSVTPLTARSTACGDTPTLRDRRCNSATFKHRLVSLISSSIAVILSGVFRSLYIPESVATSHAPEQRQGSPLLAAPFRCLTSPLIRSSPRCNKTKRSCLYHPNGATQYPARQSLPRSHSTQRRPHVGRQL